MWRCFCVPFAANSAFPVFSTHVEVFSLLNVVIAGVLRVLHVRGGVSLLKLCTEYSIYSSPRTWRCFREKAARRIGSIVFSTSVEVFLPACGLATRWHGYRYSPPPYPRCFVTKSLFAPLPFAVSSGTATFKLYTSFTIDTSPTDIPRFLPLRTRE